MENSQEILKDENQEQTEVKKVGFLKKFINNKKHDRHQTETTGIVAEKQWKAWIYLSPILILLAIFTFYPFFSTFLTSFIQQYNPIAADAENRINFFNYLAVFKNANLRNAFVTTLWIVFISVPISTMLALIISVALNSIKFLQKTLQTIFFLPYVTNAIAIGMVFSVMFKTVGYNASTGTATTFGVVNSIIGVFGIKPIIFLGVGSTYAANMFVLIFYIIWASLPFKILILLGALQSINNQYYDAAKIDSTSKWRVLWRITVPLLGPMLSYILITGFIGAFKTYTALIGIFGEVPLNPKMKTIVSIIMESLTTYKIGLASAASVILFIIIFIITRLNLYLSKRSVHY